MTAGILVAPDWPPPFELICDASNYTVGVMLGQRKDRIMHPIFYASKTLNDSQENYTTTEKEMLDVIFVVDKFQAYLVGSTVTVYIDM